MRSEIDTRLANRVRTIFVPVGQFRVKLIVRHEDFFLELLRGFSLPGHPLLLELDVKVVRGLHLSEQLQINSKVTKYP